VKVQGRLASIKPNLTTEFMDEKKIIRNLIIVIFFLVIIYSLARVGVGLDLSFGPYLKE
jgi:hypothetical protein